MVREVLDLTAQIVAAHVGHNATATEELPKLIRGVYGALENAGRNPQDKAEGPEPAVPIKQSVRQDHIVCLDCGQNFAMLKRHLRTEHQLTPEEYREKWGLPSSYPMTAPRYAEARSAIAKETGLGRGRRQRHKRKG